MNFNKLTSSYNTFSKTASTLLKDKGKVLSKIQEGIKKAIENKESLADVWDQLQLLFSLIKNYANGNYTSIPKSSIIAVLAAILYFISPLDLVPDFLMGLGFVDDAFILGFVYRKIIKELKKYQTWEDEQKKIIPIIS